MSGSEVLEKNTVDLLAGRGLTVATAESCTGGLLAKLLTDVPGASKVFPGGIVAYNSQAKTEFLGVDPGLLREKGAVCSEVAIAMANGVRRKFGTDIGIGITGIAGPDSDDSGLQPGTVFIALTTDGQAICKKFDLQGDREQIRAESAVNALNMIMAIAGNDISTPVP